MYIYMRLLYFTCFASTLCLTEPVADQSGLNIPSEILDGTTEEKIEFVVKEMRKGVCLNENTDLHSRVFKRSADISLMNYIQLLRVLLDQCTQRLNSATTVSYSNAQSQSPCTSPHTVNLTQAWRKDAAGSHLMPANGDYACDQELSLGTKWFRFTGAAGKRIANQCRPSYSCGGHGGFWTDAPMPTDVGEIKTVPVYGSWSGNCRWYRFPKTNSLTVQKCSDMPGDYVYLLHGTGSCFWTICSMDLEEF